MNDLVRNIDKLHTTELGEERIRKNLFLNSNEVEYCKKKILDKNCKFNIQGKNWYCTMDNIVITVNSFNYCIITAHKK